MGVPSVYHRFFEKCEQYSVFFAGKTPPIMNVQWREILTELCRKGKELEADIPMRASRHMENVRDDLTTLHSVLTAFEKLMLLDDGELITLPCQFFFNPEPLPEGFPVRVTPEGLYTRHKTSDFHYRDIRFGRAWNNDRKEDLPFHCYKLNLASMLDKTYQSVDATWFGDNQTKTGSQKDCFAMEGTLDLFIPGHGRSSTKALWQCLRELGVNGIGLM